MRIASMIIAYAKSARSESTQPPCTRDRPKDDDERVIPKSKWSDTQSYERQSSSDMSLSL